MIAYKGIKMKENLKQSIKKSANDNFLTLKKVRKIAKEFKLSIKEVEKEAMALNITPLRYKKNQNTISLSSQLKLLNSSVAIIGCGGLGGYIAENLARIGVGKILLFDFDTFEEHNINRQNFSSFEVVGRQKAIVVKENLEKINPALHVEAFVMEFLPQRDFHLLKECEVIVDAIDNPDLKLELASTCKEYKKSFVHGAVAGFCGQFCTNTTLENLYKQKGEGAEVYVGNLSFTVSFAASIQSCETIKLLLNLKEPLEKQILMTNLLENEFILI